MVSTRSQRVPLSSLTALTLHSNRRTASRRLPPVPQITCKGSACRKYQPDVVQCIAVGSDGAGGLEWKCEADLPNGVRFGEVGVSCEGWDGPDDPYIVRGSCGLTYSLVRSSAHLESEGYASLPSWSKSYLTGAGVPGSAGSLFNSGFNLLFSLLTLYLVASFLAKLLTPLWRRFRFPGAGRPVGGPHTPGGGGPGGGNGGGGGGGGGSGRPPFPPSGPPPPYTPAPKPDPNDGAPNAGWRPGFFTGAALGWAANALMGSTRPRRMEPVEYGAYPGMGVGGFWGGGGGGAVRQRGWGMGGAPRASVRDWDNDDRDRGVGTSGMRRSTGFGGTSVR